MLPGLGVWAGGEGEEGGCARVHLYSGPHALSHALLHSIAQLLTHTLSHSFANSLTHSHSHHACSHFLKFLSFTPVSHNYCNSSSPSNSPASHLATHTPVLLPYAFLA